MFGIFEKEITRTVMRVREGDYIEVGNKSYLVTKVKVDYTRMVDDKNNEYTQPFNIVFGKPAKIPAGRSVSNKIEYGDKTDRELWWG